MDCKLPTCSLGLRTYCVYAKYLLTGYVLLNAVVGEVDLKQTYEMFMVLCNSWYVDSSNERLFQLTSWNIDRECACGKEICIQLPSYHRLAADKTVILCLSSLILKQ